MRVVQRDDKYTVRFDARRIIDDFGVPKSVHDLLLSVGTSVGQRTVEQWRYRNAIPGEAVAALLLCHQRNGGIPLPMENYLLEREPT